MEWLKELNIVDTISIETAKYTKAEFDDKVEKIFTEILYSPLDVSEKHARLSNQQKCVDAARCPRTRFIVFRKPQISISLM